MAFHLISDALLVLLDEGEVDRGIIHAHNLTSGILTLPRITPPPLDPSPIPEAEYHSHIIFAPEMTTEVEIDNVTYSAMNINAVVGYLE